MMDGKFDTLHDEMLVMHYIGGLNNFRGVDGHGAHAILLLDVG